jgi:hypothetical protein
MKKSHLLGAVCACVITFVSVSTNAAKSVVHIAGNYGSQEALIHSMATGVNQAKRNSNEPLASGLLNTGFLISCGVLGVFLLRKSNNS